MDDNDYQLFMLLVRNPKSWTASEAQYLCRSFERLIDDENTPISSLLTTRLWRYWFFVHGETPLLANPQHDLALMVTARAFGEFVPPPTSNDFFGQYRKELEEHQKWPEKVNLVWGPKACLESEEAALDSALSNVCIIQEKGQIQEIILIGESILGVRQELFDAFFGCALRIQAGALDKVSAGAFQLSSLRTDQDVLDLPGLSNTEGTFFSSQTNDKTASDVLSELARQCKAIQDYTGFVRIQECEVQTKRQFDQELLSHVQSCFQTKAVKIIAPNPSLSPEIRGLLTYVPYYQFAHRPRPLRLVLPVEIINQPSFHELVDEFKYHTVERIIADADVRLESYERHVREHQAELKRWEETPVGLRREIWGESVTVSERFIIETGTTVRLAQPTQIPVEKYMRENVPFLIKYYQSWAARMKEAVNEIRGATEGANSAFRHLAVSLFLDMALREKADYFQSQKIRDHFEKWCRQVEPFLRYKWQVVLDSKGIGVEDIFNRHTVFHTRFQLDEAGNIIGLVVQPFAVVSPDTSTLVIDPRKPIIKVLESVDFAQPVQRKVDQTSRDVWETFNGLVAGLDPNSDEKVVGLQKYVDEHAIELLPQLLQFVISNSPAEASNLAEQEQIEKLVKELIEKNNLVSFPAVVSFLLGQGAYHSARELCHTMAVPPELKVRVLLWRTLIECRANGMSPMDLVPKLFAASGSIQQPRNVEESLIFTLLMEAKSLNLPYVQQWMDKLKGALDLSGAIGFLTKDWPQTEAYLSTPERAALWKATVAIEMLQLARKLNNSAKSINEDEESVLSLLAKLGQPLEDVLLSAMSLAPLSDVYSLMEILLGQENQKGK